MRNKNMQIDELKHARKKLKRYFLPFWREGMTHAANAQTPEEKKAAEAKAKALAKQQ